VKNNTITIDDRVAVKAGAGCKAVKGDKTKVTRTPKKRPTMVKAALGDKNDTFVDRGLVWDMSVTAFGGAGDALSTTVGSGAAVSL
jgi:hypothetical protein